jgi:hypothetical protein
MWLECCDGLDRGICCGRYAQIWKVDGVQSIERLRRQKKNIKTDVCGIECGDVRWI